MEQSITLDISGFVLIVDFFWVILSSEAFWIALSILVGAKYVTKQIQALRKLQRKDVAIRLVYEGMRNTEWQTTLHNLYDKFDYETVDWGDLARKLFDRNYTRTDQEVKLVDDIRLVLNTYEFVAVAINDQTADEHIIYHAQKSTIMKVYNNLKPFIDYIRQNIQKSAYINLTTVVEKWEKLEPPNPPLHLSHTNSN